MGKEHQCHTDCYSHCIQRIGKARTTLILIEILIVFSVSEEKKRGHSHTDSNCHCIQCNRWETKTNVIPILILTVFSVIR